MTRGPGWVWVYLRFFRSSLSSWQATSRITAVIHISHVSNSELCRCGPTTMIVTDMAIVAIAAHRTMWVNTLTSNEFPDPGLRSPLFGDRERYHAAKGCCRSRHAESSWMSGRGAQTHSELHYRTFVRKCEHADGEECRAECRRPGPPTHLIRELRSSTSLLRVAERGCGIVVISTASQVLHRPS